MSFDVAIRLQRGTWQRGVAFAAGPGVTALVGPSGAGKTSTLDAVAGLLRPVAGHIAVGGEVLFDAGARIALPPERRACGYVFQDYRLFPHRDVRANLLYGARGVAPARALLSLDEACAFLGLGPLLHRKPATLSGGEAQRVAIARALAPRPPLIFGDEPTGNLDAATGHAIIEVLLARRADTGATLVIITHDRELASLCDRVVTLGDGMIVSDVHV